MIVLLAVLGLVSGLAVACGDDDDDDGGGPEEALPTPTPTPLDAELLNATLPPNEIIEVDQYYGGEVCRAYLVYHEAVLAGPEDGVTPSASSTPESSEARQARALPLLVAELEAIQAPAAYADVHAALLDLARGTDPADQRSASRLIGMDIEIDDERLERLQAVANDQRPCQEFLQRFGLPAWYNGVP